MKVLVVGSGGREHAIVWKLSQSPKVSKIYCAPGNGGISQIAECVGIDAMDIDGMVGFACKEKIDMVVVAPDDPLGAGMVDALEEAGIRAFGPVKNAAAMEASKVFSKSLMKRFNIPTAAYGAFSDSASALKYLESCSYPVFIKTDGLARGKGAIMAEDYRQGAETVREIIDGKVFGKAGDRIIIEEYLEGPEVTILAFTDGKTLVPMVSSQDHKRVFDGDRGPNTGGMGAFSPSKIYDSELAGRCMKEIYLPTMNAMRESGIKFKGVLYFGLIITREGPKVLEYNARFGDPEAQVVIPRLKNDLFDIFDAIIDERLDTVKIEWNDNVAVCVVMASGGYPGKYKTGCRIDGIEEAGKDPQITVFHAGTVFRDGHFYTNGGRVLGVTAMDINLKEARKRAYEAVAKIHFDYAHYRKEIAL